MPARLWLSPLKSKRYIFFVHGVLLNRCSYPDNNCAALYEGLGTPVNPQDVFPNYLTHNSGLGIVQKLLNSTSIAQQYQKEFIMFETNSASCGGFRGISNVYGISLWGLDYGLQMAYSNFSHALFHVGGQDVYYNVSISSYVRVTMILRTIHSPSFVSFSQNDSLSPLLIALHSSSDEPVKLPPVDCWSDLLPCYGHARDSRQDWLCSRR